MGYLLFPAIEILGTVILMSHVAWQVFIVFVPIIIASLWFQVYFINYNCIGFLFLKLMVPIFSLMFISCFVNYSFEFVIILFLIIHSQILAILHRCC